MPQPNTAIFTTKYTVCDMTDNLLGKTIVWYWLYLVRLYYICNVVMINRFHDHQLFLDGLVEAADVLSYIKNNPFG